MNLLNETIENIKASGHGVKDVVFIGSESSGHSCSWEQFSKLANRTYDSDFGWAEVATDLIIVFSDGQKMWRNEYDGSEWWEYSMTFIQPKRTKPIKSLFFRETGWETLAECNGEED